MQFLVTAHDFKDDDAINRRQAARTEHLAGATKLMQDNILLSAGALLDDSGKMIGSTLLYEVDSKEALVKLLDADPYISNRVWEKYAIQEVKLFKPT